MSAVLTTTDRDARSKFVLIAVLSVCVCITDSKHISNDYFLKKMYCQVTEWEYDKYKQMYICPSEHIYIGQTLQSSNRLSR